MSATNLPTTIAAEDCVLIPLFYRGKQVSESAVVDAKDWDLVKPFHWHPKVKEANRYATTRIYDSAKGRWATLVLGRLIMELDPGDHRVISYADSDGYNCRRENLTICENRHASRHRRKLKGSLSKYKGLNRQKSRSKKSKGWLWRAHVQAYGAVGKCIRSPLFKTQEEAAYAYNVIAKQVYGKFAVLNVLPDGWKPPRPISSEYEFKKPNQFVGPRLGAKQGKIKIETRLAMRAMRLEGMKLKDLSALFGISEGWVSRIVRSEYRSRNHHKDMT